MELTFLRAAQRLAKRFVRHEDGTIEKIPHPNVYLVSSYTETVSTIEEFHAHILLAAGAGHCLQKGLLDKQLDNESRAKHTLRDAPTKYMCLDLDEMTAYANVDEVLRSLGLDNIDYIVQWSASQGLKPGLNAHIFMLLEHAQSPAFLKQWLMYQNYTVAALREQLELNRTNDGLRYALDVTTCQNDKLLYVATPTFDGLDDPFENEPRIELVKRTHRTATLAADRDRIRNFDFVLERNDIVNELRRAKGLRKKLFQHRFDERAGQVVVANPEAAISYEVKDAGDYIRLNINGGDSWAYWHPKDNYKIIHSFKDECDYETRKLLPEYYQECVRAEEQQRADALELQRPDDNADAPIRFVFNEKETAMYYKALYDPRSKNISLWPAKTIKHLEDYCALWELEMPDAVPDWSLIFDPTSDRVVDPEANTINMHRASTYRVQRQVVDNPQLPDAYTNLIHHVLAHDETSVEYFLNWLAYLWQTGKKPQTAWVLHGTEGTGKGKLFDILSALFGPAQVVKLTNELIAEKFNDWARTCQILWVDEADTDSVDQRRVAPKIRNWITEPTISLREMHKGARPVPSYMGIIFAANALNATVVSLRDRRWNIPPRQEEQFLPSDAEHDAWYATPNLQALANYLSSRPVNEAMVRIPMASEAKAEMQETTTSVPEKLVARLKAGDFAFLLDQVPTIAGSGPSDVLTFNYKAVLKEIFSQLAEAPLGETVGVKLTRDEIQVLFDMVTGWKQSGLKFATAAARFGLPFGNHGRVWRNGRTQAGRTFDFILTEEVKQQYLHLMGEGPHLKEVPRSQKVKAND